ncbi:hypothetical protein [Deinococcus yavapaiensis]|uniref:Uncharacterized protein n=1 Tax=Deinococcus yavapaiensis KR-236 TaxID=694435 RepID=A0A318S7U4_9DEIO|nr:hypothetical protein [Deinococcus yavapaiensis]PYE51841.1 hypothetical protein DES52_11442 [Deinococcus yavapaiensis KR-236]
MSIRLRCTTRNLSSGTRATVLESLAPLLTPGDLLGFCLDEAVPTDGVLEFGGHAYRVGNVRLLEDPDDERFTVVECELADEPAETNDEQA